jgi:hypothetical protein
MTQSISFVKPTNVVRGDDWRVLRFIPGIFAKAVFGARGRTRARAALDFGQGEYGLRKNLEIRQP